MKKLGIPLVLLVGLSLAANTPAQRVNANPPAGPAVPVTDLSKIDAGKVLQELAGTKTATNDANGQETSPLEVIAAFLQLRPGQINQLQQLLQARQQNVVPRAQQLQALGQQLDTLLASGGNPAQVGITVIQIHALQQQIAQVQQAFFTQLIALLDQDQLQRLQAVQIAAQLQPILPAFRLIFPF